MTKVAYAISVCATFATDKTMIIKAGPQYNGRASKRMHAMAKPIGAVCNINCQYCYYLSKQDLLSYKKCSVNSLKMDNEQLENYIKQYIEQQNTPEIIFSWQGGEPTILGIEYFENVVRLQKKYCPDGAVISNDLQTNGTLLNDKWCHFLKENNFLVGLSIDGPELLHNAYRQNNSGKGTFKRVMKSVSLLKKHGVNFSTLTCVNDLTAKEPVEVYTFLRDVVESPQIQFIPIVEPKSFRKTAPQHWGIEEQVYQDDPRVQPSHPHSVVESWCVSPNDWGDFLIKVFNEWIKKDIGKVFVQYFEAFAETWMGRQNPLCTLGSLCGKGLAVEPNGDVFSCDHYVYPEFKLGNINDSQLNSMAFSSRQQQFGFDKAESLTTQCRQCEYLFACYGECPKNRFLLSSNGERGQAYLCQGWKKFFNHIDVTMAYILKASNQRVIHGKYKSTF